MPHVSKDSFSSNFLKDMCKIIGEFIESRDLHYHTDKLKEIIVKFDDSKQNFVKAITLNNNKIEIEEFCSKMLYKIRYIFSKLGRLLNLHENPSINKWISKDNRKLLRNITKANPKAVEQLKSQNIQLINMDAHENKNSKLALMLHFKESLKKWRNDIDYANLK